MSKNLILYGAGTTGRCIARAYRDEVICLVDSNPAKWGLVMEGFPVLSPEEAQEKYPEATWTSSVIRPEYREVLVILKDMGVKTVPVWSYLPKRHTLPPGDVSVELRRLVSHDPLSTRMLNDQLRFRHQPDYGSQEAASNIDDIYFEDFYTRREDEHFVDLGAWEGDTVTEFIKRWPSYKYISAFEPDPANFAGLQRNHSGRKFFAENAAVADFEGKMSFAATGDMSATLGGEGELVNVVKLDTYFPACEPVPTFIKMDIESSEPLALWGARRILKEHRPVLAVCAYHTADHFWEIPLLIHAIQPEYELFFRRYADGAFEIIWYAVPPERLA